MLRDYRNRTVRPFSSRMQSAYLWGSGAMRFGLVVHCPHRLDSKSQNVRVSNLLLQSTHFAPTHSSHHRRTYRQLTSTVSVRLTTLSNSSIWPSQLLSRPSHRSAREGCPDSFHLVVHAPSLGFATMRIAPRLPDIGRALSWTTH